MTPDQFVYWLQGFAELNGQPPTPEQWRSINDHLKTVFVKVTPFMHQPGYRSLELRRTDLYPPTTDTLITC